MAIEAPPLYLQGGAYPARLDRFQIAYNHTEGVAAPTHCKVTQRAAGANFTVDIAPGTFWIAGDDQTNQGTYQGRVTATENVSLAAAPAGSNQRYDVITLRVNDPNAGGNTGNTVQAVVVTGTATASPVVPSLPASSLPIAVIGPIASGTASITNSLIHDTWTSTGPAFATSCRLLSGDVAPCGEMRLMASNALRVGGWLWCNGAAVLRATYPDLFASLGTTYGAGDGSTTFNLPNLQDRVPVATGSTFATQGATGGEVTHLLTAAESGVAAHSHAISDPGHSHNLSNLGSIITPNAGFSVLGSGGVNVTTTGIAANTTGITINNATATSAASAHNIMQPYQVVSGWIIKT